MTRLFRDLMRDPLPDRGPFRSSPLFLLLTLLLPPAVLPPTALAYDYGRDIEVDSQEDIYELYNLGDLSEEETDRLVTLFESKLDLNRATAEELYALPGVTLELARAIVDHRLTTPILSIDDLMKVKGMTPDLFRQVKAFVRVSAWAGVKELVGKSRISGSADARLAWSFDNAGPPISLSDAEASGGSFHPSELGLDSLPEFFVRGRANIGNHVQTGALLAFGEGPAGFTYNPDLQAFELDWGRPLLNFSKGYVRYENPQVSAILGSYTVGFGQHLVFDETRRYQTNDFLPDDDAYGSESISVPQRLMGAAVTWRPAELGRTSLSVTAFVSRRRNDLYQYYFQLPDRIADDPNDASTPVLLEGVPVYPIVLPNVYTEQLAGAHLQARLSKKTWLGLTGYYGGVLKDFDFVFTSSMPTRDRYGALGIDFGAELSPVLLTGELAMMDNLSTAFLLRGVMDLKRIELMGTVYAYSEDFDNPHSRGFSDVDTYEGERDRDEAGGQLRLNWKIIKPLQLRLTGHLWTRPSIPVNRAALDARLDYTWRRKVDVALVGSYKDKDLSVVGRNRNYTSGTEESYANLDALEGEDPDATPPPTDSTTHTDEPNGARASLALQAATTLVRGLSLEATYKRTYTDASYHYYDVYCTDTYGWQVGQDIWLRARYALKDGLRLSSRLRYLDEDVYGDAGTRQLEGYLQGAWRKKGLGFSLRYGFRTDLKDEPMGITTYCETSGDPNCPADNPASSSNLSSDTADLTMTHIIQATFETKF